MARPMAKLIVNLCWSGWRKLNRHSQRKSSSSLFIAPPSLPPIPSSSFPPAIGLYSFSRASPTTRGRE
eukprot:7241358-Pyramimonas_sp.AAC.1